MPSIKYYGTGRNHKNRKEKQGIYHTSDNEYHFYYRCDNWRYTLLDRARTDIWHSGYHDCDVLQDGRMRTALQTLTNKSIR